MKKFLITIFAVLFITIGTNASGNKSTRSFYEDYVMRSCLKKIQKSLTNYNFFSHYDAGSGETWVIVGLGDATNGGIITTAYYWSGGNKVFAAWVENPNSPYGYGPYTNEWSWVGTDTVHVVCKVHWNLADEGYFTVGEDLVTAIEV